MKYALLLLSTGLLAAAPATAQTSPPDSLTARLDSVLYRPLLVPLNAWRPAGNAATLPLARLPQFGQAGFDYEQASGAFRRPQQARTEQTGAFGASGYRRLGRGHVLGQLRYERRQATAVRWANGEDLFNGNPYFWADSVGGDWERSYLSAALQAAAPLGRGLTAGLGLGYRAGQGARLTDPKPFFQSRVARVAPGLWWQRGRHGLGLTVAATFTTEQNEQGVGATDFPLLFRVRGPGTFSATPVVTAERQTDGRRLEALAQYQRHGNRLHLLLSGEAGWRSEEVQQSELNINANGVATLRLVSGGQLRAFTAGGEAAGLLPGERHRYGAALRYHLYRAEGTDPLFQTVNVTSTRHRAELPLRVLDAASRWQLTLTPGYDDQRTADLGARTTWRARRALLGLDFLGRRAFTPRLTGWVQPALSLEKTLASSFQALRTNRYLEAVTRPDAAVQATDVLGGGLTLGADLAIASVGRLRLRAGYELRHAPGFGRRGQLRAGLEFFY